MADSIFQPSAKQIRRRWSDNEEKTLLVVLEDMVVEGAKGDNNTFKPGSHEEVVRRMKVLIPEIILNTGQVVNKIKGWNDKYSEVVDMLGTSGFGWDDAKKCVVVDSDQVWAEYVKKHPNVKKYVNKTFQEFERLQGIFGKDRATGDAAEGPIDAAQNVETNSNYSLEDDVNMDCEGETSALNASLNGASIGGESTRNRPSRKRNRNSEKVDEFIQVFAQTMANAQAELTKVAEKIMEPPKDSGVGEQLKSLGLTTEERFKWTDKKAYNDTLLKLGDLFKKNFETFTNYTIGTDSKLTEEILAAGPNF